MKLSWKTGLAAAVACAVFTACETIAISHYQLSALNKGMSPADVSTKLQPGPRQRGMATVATRIFQFESYLLSTGMHTDHYVLAYENERLTYWGYISEFRKHPDPVLVEAVNRVYPSLMPAK